MKLVPGRDFQQFGFPGTRYVRYLVLCLVLYAVCCMYVCMYVQVVSNYTETCYVLFYPVLYVAD